MSKSAVNDVIGDIKKLADYDIVDTDLNALILVAINLAIKRMKQWFMDAELFDEIGAHDTFSTVTDQEYIEIGTDTPDLDQNIKLSERTNDSPIMIIPFAEYRDRFPDPSASSSQAPDVAAFFANRIYLGPTPSGVITLYLDYIKLVTKLVAGGTIPYEDKYDEIIINFAMVKLRQWMDSKNAVGIRDAKDDLKTAVHDLIVGAARNIGTNQQTQSRREGVPFFAPRKDVT